MNEVNPRKKQQQQPSSLYAKRRHSTSKVFLIFFRYFFILPFIKNISYECECGACVYRLCVRLAFIVSQVEIDANDRVGGWVRQCALSRTHSSSVPHTARIE